MKKTITVIIISSLFLSIHTLRAQAPEGTAAAPLPGPEYPGENDNYGYDILSRAEQMIQNNDQAGAMNLLSINLDRFTRMREMFFNKMVSLYLAQSNISEARSFYLQAAKQDPGLARSGFGLIYNHYLGKGDREASAAWTEQLTALTLPEDLNAQAFTWHLQAICSKGISGQTSDLAKTIIARFNTEICRSVFAPAITDLINSGKIDDAMSLLTTIEKDAKGKDALRSMVLTEKTRISIMQKRWKEAETFIIKNASSFSDNDLAGIIAFYASAAKNKEEVDGADRICAHVINNQKDKNAARNMAASCSLKILKSDDQLSEIPGRLEKFMAAGIDTANLYTLFNNYFYLVTLSKNADLTKKILVFGEKLLDRLDRPEDQKQLTVLLLDGYFILGDYARSLEIVEANIKLWETEWGNSAKDKIGAHLSLNNKKYKEAIEGFRKYMDYVAKNNEILRDPVTGQIYTSDMVLGFNAMRIGDILRDNLKDEDAARKAYDEAEQYYIIATAKVGPNSNEAKYIEEQKTLLASRKKK